MKFEIYYQDKLENITLSREAATDYVGDMCEEYRRSARKYKIVDTYTINDYEIGDVVRLIRPMATFMTEYPVGTTATIFYKSRGGEGEDDCVWLKNAMCEDRDLGDLGWVAIHFIQPK